LFLGINFEKQMLSFYESKISKVNALQTDNWKNLDKKIINSNFKKYTKELTQEQIQYIEFVCHDEMKILGYDFDFPLLTLKEFNLIKDDLTKSERNEKHEYQLISENEKLKRKVWYDKFFRN
jgi:hypothetical protein